jgi:superfamily II DNA/RNA helicase
MIIKRIDVADIKYVINIDYPLQTEDYIHRIGRTARTGNTGTAFTFITNDNARHVPKLVEVLKESNQYISDGLLNMARSQMRGKGGFNSMYLFIFFVFEFFSCGI